MARQFWLNASFLWEGGVPKGNFGNLEPRWKGFLARIDGKLWVDGRPC